MSTQLIIEKDLPALAVVCLKTAFNGHDATHLIEQPEILADLYVAPYFYATNTLTISTHRDSKLCGYLVAAYDTVGYTAWLNRHWLPELRKKYPRKASYTSSLEQYLYETVHEVMSPPACAVNYPCHAHINIMPQTQRSGFGSELLDRLQKKLIEKKCGFHVTISKENLASNKFFLRHNMNIIEQDLDSITMGKPLPKLMP